eukprot:CAMPEP_0172663750 /NCGR_PEP_ID=MMETSP1074-20121228/6138_1 /TAXON_ID=2916 /ORGANISM="Ceratium fusus, Strain PA161109" /LENGTH=333 /DNA_ID=CAMNT_0013479795 /DNA_START=57 /DNA_END=1058 /DNA_ORIENTATION=+
MAQHPSSMQAGNTPLEEPSAEQETSNNEGSMAPRAVSMEPTEKRHSSPSPLPPYKPVLWGLHIDGARTRRPSHERDSLRNRSREGRPGSRKNRRWSHSVDMVNALRRTMAANGESTENLTMDADGNVIGIPVKVEWQPSVFYRLLELEGPDGALEAWEAAEMRRRPRSRPRVKSSAKINEEKEQTTRRAFGGSVWQFVMRNESAQDLLRELEQLTTDAFGHSKQKRSPQWLLRWNGESLEAEDGAPPAEEVAISGFGPMLRKLVHSYASVSGLHSTSQLIEGGLENSQEKLIILKPPRSSAEGGDEDWVAPFSVAQVFAAAKSAQRPQRGRAS